MYIHPAILFVLLMLAALALVVLGAWARDLINFRWRAHCDRLFIKGYQAAKAGRAESDYYYLHRELI